MYRRKTKDVWCIMSNYGYGWECEVQCDTLEEAKGTLMDYLTNCKTYGGKVCHFRMEKRRVRKEKEE